MNRPRTGKTAIAATRQNNSELRIKSAVKAISLALTGITSLTILSIWALNS